MLSTLLIALLSAPPVCNEQVHFSWPSSSFPGVHEGALKLMTFAWVRPGQDAFVIELVGVGRVLVGSRAHAPAVTHVEGWTREQAELRLPLAQGGVVLSAAGGGKGCVVMVKAGDLGGPIAGNVRIDARTKWKFELRDRSMKQVLLSF